MCFYVSSGSFFPYRNCWTESIPAHPHAQFYPMELDCEKVVNVLLPLSLEWRKARQPSGGGDRSHILFFLLRRPHLFLHASSASYIPLYLKEEYKYCT